MNKITTILIAVVCLLLAPGAITARDGYSASGKSFSTRPNPDSANHFSSANRAAKKSTTLHSISVDGVQRDAKGRVERSSTVREKFLRPGHPPGHAVDHSVPLKRGDSNSPSKSQTAKPKTR